MVSVGDLFLLLPFRKITGKITMPSDYELSKDIKITFDGERPKTVTLPESIDGIGTLELEVPVFASVIRFEVMSVYTKKYNGFKKIRVWKKGILMRDSHLTQRKTPIVP